MSHLFNQATQAHQRGQLLQAEQLYRQLVARAPGHAEAHHLLGLVCSQQGRQAEAVEHLRRAIAVDSHNPTYHNNLGEVWRRQGRWEQARQSYQQALQLAPSFAQAHYNLANVLKLQGDLDAAVSHYHQALTLEPAYVKAHYNLGNTYMQQEKFEAAAQAYEQALRLKPDFAEAQRNLGGAFEAQGNISVARPYYQRALQLDTTDILFKLHAETLCPPVPVSNAEIDHYRVHLAETLARYIDQELRLDVRQLAQLSGEPALALNSQGRNDLPLKRQYAQIFRHCFQPRPRPIRPGKPHLGFVVLKQENLFLQGMGGILSRLPAERFRLTVVCTSQQTARRCQTQITHPTVQYLIIPPLFNEAVRLVDEARFDLLNYWEVGTDPVNYFLPFCGLAPVQCSGWGWPATSGIPQLDYFISSDLLETDEANTYYTETLIRLPGLPAYFHRPSRLEVRPNRSDFGFSEDQHLYLCNQHPRKFHPDFDPILADILRRDPQGVLLTREGGLPYLVKLLFERWQKVMPDVVDRIRPMPWFPDKQDYYRFLAAVDVNLDTVHYGGTNTVYDTLAMGTPVVTLPTPFMRGRYAHGAYRRMGMLDCVAGSPEDYVKLALTLGSDPAYRAEISGKIDQASPVLFEDPAAVTELVDFFEWALAEAQNK